MNNQELFKHMKDQHGLTLLESEMLEIELICIKGIKSQPEGRDFYSQDNVLEILENATDLQDAITILKEGNDGDI